MPYLCHCRFPFLGLADLWRVTEERGALSEEFGRKDAREPGRIALLVGRFVGTFCGHLWYKNCTSAGQTISIEK